MRYDTEHKQRTHEKIVREAAKAIRQEGPDKVGIASLMARLGLTQGGFYAHFKSKNVLVAEAITHIFNERYKAFQEFQQDVDPAEGLARYIDYYLSTHHRDRRDKGCPVVALNSDLARMPAITKKRFEAGMQRMTETLADIMKKLNKPHPHALATSILSEMVGAMAVARSVSNTDLSEQILETARASIKERVGLNT
jgi:TetR/AcrR family transcriptional repressor of nem operon